MTSVVHRETARRIVKDVREVMSDSTMAETGIYYTHDMDHFLNGHAMIIGPPDTPYEGGLFFFDIVYPETYPFAPPVVRFINRFREGRVRMNPNLYRSGKVCLSILNTWAGEPWSSCQTIRTVLLTLVTVLNEKPLLNEPGICHSDPGHASYNRAVTYATIVDCFARIALGCVDQKSPDVAHVPNIDLFRDAILCHSRAYVERARQRLKELDNATAEIETISVRIYGNTLVIDWAAAHDLMDRAVFAIKDRGQI